MHIVAYETRVWHKIMTWQNIDSS